MSDVVALRWPHLGGHGLDAFVTGRDGGVSEGAYSSLNLSLGVGDDPGRVLENRRRVASAAGVELADMVFAHQVHGRDVAVVTDADRGRGTLAVDDAPAADALVTATPGLGIAVLVGDCVPIVLYDPAAHVVAAVHAGWRGTVARVDRRRARRHGGSGGRGRPGPGGPRPGHHRRPVPGGRRRGRRRPRLLRRRRRRRLGGIVRPDGTGRWTFDLWAANHRLLVEAGVDPAHIDVSPVGTGPGTPFFSDRTARPCGRFAAIARLSG